MSVYNALTNLNKGLDIFALLVNCNREQKMLQFGLKIIGEGLTAHLHLKPQYWHAFSPHCSSYISYGTT